MQKDDVFKTGEETIGRAIYVASTTNGNVEEAVNVGAVFSFLVKATGRTFGFKKIECDVCCNVRHWNDM